MRQAPNVSLFKLWDIANFLRGAGYEKYTKEDPMVFINHITDLIQAGDGMRSQIENNTWDEAVKKAES